MDLKKTTQLAGRLSRRNRRKSSQMRGGRSAAFHGILKNTLRWDSKKYTSKQPKTTKNNQKHQKQPKNTSCPPASPPAAPLRRPILRQDKRGPRRGSPLTPAKFPARHMHLRSTSCRGNSCRRQKGTMDFFRGAGNKKVPRPL